jgi:hypothetical protein
VTARLWLDVEDLYEYVRADCQRPSGIQRLAFEVCRELQERYGSTGLVHFVRHSLTGNEFEVVQWSEVAALFAGLATNETVPLAKTADGPVFPHLPARQLIRRLAYRLPPSLRTQIADAVLTQAKALRAWGRLLGALARGVVRLPLKLVRHFREHKAASAPAPRVFNSRFADLAAPGDILLMLAATWSHPDYAGLINRRCKANGLQFALLVYDLIPVRRPEWCDHLLVRLFRKWIDTVLPLCDQVFAISHATASDVEAYARERRISLPSAVVTLPIGSTAWQPAESCSDRLPAAGSGQLRADRIDHRGPQEPPAAVPCLAAFAGGNAAGSRSDAGIRRPGRVAGYRSYATDCQFGKPRREAVARRQSVRFRACRTVPWMSVHTVPILL